MNNESNNSNNVEMKKDSQKLKLFLASSGGKIVLTVIFAVIIYGIMFAVTATGSEYIALVLCAVCGYFGWQSLSRIQPSMFLWMNIAGWLIYFFIKGVLSLLVGIFVAPFVIGKKISNLIAGSLAE